MAPRVQNPCSVEIHKYWYRFYNAVSRCLDVSGSESFMKKVAKK